MIPVFPMRAPTMSSRGVEIEGYVYLYMRPSDRALKIGRSENPAVRFSELERLTGERLEVIHIIACIDHKNMETILHNRYMVHCVNGEWFFLPRESIEEVKAFDGMTGLGYTEARTRYNAPEGSYNALFNTVRTSSKSLADTQTVTYKIHPDNETWVNEYCQNANVKKQDVLRGSIKLFRDMIENQEAPTHV